MPTLSDLQTNNQNCYDVSILIRCFHPVTMFQYCHDLSILFMINHAASYNFQTNNIRRSKASLLGNR